MSLPSFILNIPYNAFFLVYVLIACNFLAEIFGCKLQKLLRESMIAKHIVGFSLIMFLIIFAEPSIRDTGSYFKGALYSIVLYIWFVMTTKTHIYITLIIIALFITLYFLQLWKESVKEKDEERFKEIEMYQLGISFLSFFITVGGVYNYYMLKSIEYKKRFNTYTFFLGKTSCKNDAMEAIVRP